jgi:hypothetical protein
LLFFIDLAYLAIYFQQKGLVAEEMSKVRRDAEAPAAHFGEHG